MKKEKETEKEKKASKRDGQEEKIEPIIAPLLEKEEIIEVEKAQVQVPEKVFRREDARAMREKRDRDRETELWIPKTDLGRKVREGKIKDIDEIFRQNARILEHPITDLLIPGLESELINIGQAKGKFGGGKRRPWRQTQKKSAEGNVPKFGCMAVVGDKAGHVGVGYGKAKETVPAKEKAIRSAKVNIMPVLRGCGSPECICQEPHSIPIAVEGKSGSVKIKLLPAPKGTGLVIDDECKKVMILAGIKDIYSKSFGQTRTKFNMIKATIDALQKLGKFVK
jgi:small subunit ribosomal protein S5